MKNIEPKIYRQRIIIEGHFAIKPDGETIRKYLSELSKILQMRIFAGPFSWPPDEWTHKEVELHELNGFIAWTESGCQVYAWRSCSFFSADIYSCKRFDSKKVIDFTRNFFDSDDIVFEEI